MSAIFYILGFHIQFSYAESNNTIVNSQNNTSFPVQLSLFLYRRNFIWLCQIICNLAPNKKDHIKSISDLQLIN